MQTFLAEEYGALRHGAGVRERTERARIAVVGSDRLSYLHAMLTADVASLAPGTGCYSAYLTPQGRMIADMRVLDLGDLTLIDLELPTASEVQEKLEQFVFSEDVQLRDITETLGDVSIVGPRAAQVISSVMGGAVTPEALGRLVEHQSIRVPFEGATAVIASGGAMGLPEFDVYVDRAHVPSIVAGSMTAGAIQVAEAALEVVRVEAGVPRFGHDMNADTIPLEAGIENRAISFTKGCYPGQEVITRVLHRGHGRVARRLVGLAVEGAVVPKRGDRLLAAEKEIGTVTSAVLSPAIQAPVALGYALRDFTSPGTAVTILHGDLRLGAKVADLPFVSA